MMEEAHVRVVVRAHKFGLLLKDSLVVYLKEKGIEIKDLGVDKYYSMIAVKVTSELAKEKKSFSERKPLLRGLLVCKLGVGASIFTNQFGGMYAALYNSVDKDLNAQSINNTNVLILEAKVFFNPSTYNAMISNLTSLVCAL